MTVRILMRYCSILVSLILPSVPIAFGQTVITVGSGEIMAGGTVSIPVSINNAGNASDIQFDIVPSPGVGAVNISGCTASAAPGTFIGPNQCSVVGTTTVRYALAANAPPIANYNPIGSLSYTLTSDATGTITLSIEDLVCSDEAAQPVACSVANGSITITAPPVLEPDGSIAPASRNFGNVFVGTTSQAQEFTVNSTGAADLQITSIGLSGGFFAQTNNCPSGAPGLLSGQSCTINVTCTPLSAGLANDTLTVATNAGNRTADVSCTGVTPPPPAPVFGSNVQPGGSIGVIPDVEPFNLIISNTGTAALEVTSVSLTDPAGAFVVNPTSPFNVQPASSQGIQISCSVEGETGALALATNDPNRPNVTYNLSCQNPVAMATPIPTLSTWGLIILSGLLGLLAFRQRKGGMRFSA